MRWPSPGGELWRTLWFVCLAALIGTACSSAADDGATAVPVTVDKSTTTVAADDPLDDLGGVGGPEGSEGSEGNQGNEGNDEVDSAGVDSVPSTGAVLDSQDSFEIPDKVTPPPTTAPPTTLAPTTVPPIEVAAGTVAYYVDGQNGDDGADGTSVERAWRTLGRGIDALQPGTTVFVLDGVYDELRSPNQAHYVIRDKRGAADAWTRLLAYPDHRPKIIATSTSGIEILFSDFVEVSGFEIEGVGFGPDNTQGYGIIARDGHHFVFQDNVIHGVGNSGIGGGMQSSHFNVVNNTVYDNGWWSPDGSSGISLWRLTNVAGGDDGDGYSNRIIGNTLFRNENRIACSCPPGGKITDGNGIIIDQSDINGYAGRTLIANNTIFNNGGRAVNVHQSSRVDIVNNTTFQNSFTSENFAGERAEIAAFDANDVRIQNNLLQPLDGIDALWVRGGVDQMNNVLVGGTPGADGTNIRVADAQFVNASVDPSVADFRLNPTSPVYDVGIEPTSRSSDPVGAG